MTAMFHLAFPVDDLEAARRFYGGAIGCTEGRACDNWIDFDFHGHQITAHLAPRGSEHISDVDAHAIPIPHFGLILAMADWQALRDRLIAAGTAFVVEPYIRFAGQPGEQATMFLRDPAGNALEFKAFGDPARVFAR